MNEKEKEQILKDKKDALNVKSDSNNGKKMIIQG